MLIIPSLRNTIKRWLFMSLLTTLCVSTLPQAVQVIKRPKKGQHFPCRIYVVTSYFCNEGLCKFHVSPSSLLFVGHSCWLPTLVSLSGHPGFVTLECAQKSEKNPTELKDRNRAGFADKDYEFKPHLYFLLNM